MGGRWRRISSIQRCNVGSNTFAFIWLRGTQSSNLPMPPSGTLRKCIAASLEFPACKLARHARIEETYESSRPSISQICNSCAVTSISFEKSIFEDPSIGVLSEFFEALMGNFCVDLCWWCRGWAAAGSVDTGLLLLANLWNAISSGAGVVQFPCANATAVSVNSRFSNASGR